MPTKSSITFKNLPACLLLVHNSEQFIEPLTWILPVYPARVLRKTGTLIVQNIAYWNYQ